MLTKTASNQLNNRRQIMRQAFWASDQALHDAKKIRDLGVPLPLNIKLQEEKAKAFMRRIELRLAVRGNA